MLMAIPDNTRLVAASEMATTLARCVLPAGIGGHVTVPEHAMHRFFCDLFYLSCSRMDYMN
jgi:hypothetical protein